MIAGRATVRGRPIPTTARTLKPRSRACKVEYILMEPFDDGKVRIDTAPKRSEADVQTSRNSLVLLLICLLGEHDLLPRSCGSDQLMHSSTDSSPNLRQRCK